jgi:hypothetical protein
LDTPFLSLPSSHFAEVEAIASHPPDFLRMITQPREPKGLRRELFGNALAQRPRSPATPRHNGNVEPIL